MRILSITTLFPSRVQPVHAVFVYNRIRQVAQLHPLHVIAPIPYFPFDHLIKKYAERRAIPRSDQFDNIQVIYPRYLSIPALFKPLDGFFVLLAVWWAGRKLRQRFQFDVLDTHLTFPDGFAGVLLGKLWKLPVSITLRGHDINVLPTDQFPVRKKQIQFALREADLIIGVADALRRNAVVLGADENKTVTISNGVDRSKFFPVDRMLARQKLGLPLERKIILSVGRIVENKGYHLIIEAMQKMQESGLPMPYFVIVGGAADEALYPARLQTMIRELGMQEHVRLAGPQRNETLQAWYSAADVYCLASQTEGWANVLLESLACGTPVVATNIWGTPEVISGPEYGILVERNATDLARGLSQALQQEWDQHKMIAYTAQQTWERVAQRVSENFQRIINQRSLPNDRYDSDHVPPQC